MLEADLLGGRHERLFEVELADNGGVQVFVGRPDNGVVAVTALRLRPGATRTQRVEEGRETVGHRYNLEGLILGQRYGQAVVDGIDIAPADAL